MAAVDMGLTLGDWNACVNLQKTLLNNDPVTPRALASVWRNIFGSTPSAIHELVNVRHNHDVKELALVIARIHFTFLAVSSRAVHRYQIRSAAELRMNGARPRYEYHQNGYARTHAKIMASEEDMNEDDAAAHAYFIHAKAAPTPSVVAGGRGVPPALEICSNPPASADHLHLPPAYVGVDMNGKLVLLDAARGASPIPVGSVVPHNWMVRVSSHANKFLVGDNTCALFLTLNEDLTAAIGEPLALPRYPPGCAYEVDNSWVVWQNNKSPRAMKWDETTMSAQLCSDEDARLHAATIQDVVNRGNGVWRDETCVACLPALETITALKGTTVAFDAFTHKGDWWRVDVRARKAWVVGVPTSNIVCAIAPLVEWSGQG